MSETGAAWWEGNKLIDVNALTPERIASFGLDVNGAADRLLLTSQVGSALAAQRRFNKTPYAGFPTTSTVAQALRPFPQFSTINYLWTPLGRTRYDSLQATPKLYASGRRGKCRISTSMTLSNYALSRTLFSRGEQVL